MPTKSTDYPAAPTLDRMKEVAPFSQKIGEFLEWLGERGVTLCTSHEHTEDCHTMNMKPTEFRRWAKQRMKDDKMVWQRDRKPFELRDVISLEEFRDGRFNSPKCGCYDGQYMASHDSIDKLLHAFFEIDANQAEQERRAVLDWVRKQNKG